VKLFFSVQSGIMRFGCVYICALMSTDTKTCFGRTHQYVPFRPRACRSHIYFQ